MGHKAFAPSTEIPNVGDEEAATDKFGIKESMKWKKNTMNYLS